MSRIEMRRISKAFPGVQALADVSLVAEAGEVHALVGENGAGKSTLMKILSGVYIADEGDILLDGESVKFRAPREAEDAGVAIIHQELNLVRDLSVAENIFLGREPVTGLGLVDFVRLCRDAEALLERLGSNIDPRAPVSTLRIGEQQIVEIAKALSLDTRVLIMDEPTSALSDSEVERLFEIVRSLVAQDVTVLYISHKMDELFTIADTFTVLRDGRGIGSRKREETNIDEIIAMMVGRELDDFFHMESHRQDRVLMEVHDLCAPHPDKPGAYLLDHVSFELRQGEILGIAGLMGAGRTELLEAIFGALPGEVSGAVRLEGKPISCGSPQEAIAAGLALVTEDRKTLGLVEELSVRANLTLASLEKHTRWGVLRAGSEQAAADHGIERFRVRTPGSEVAIGTLSGGNQQKVIVARWLETEPRVLLLDDPTRGIDIGAKAEMYQLMQDLAAGGMGIVMVSSELPEVLSMSDRILVLCEGRITGAFNRGEAGEEQIMQCATQFRKTVGV